MKFFSVMQIFLNLLTISGILLLVNKGLRNKSEENKLKNGVDEKNNSIPLSSVCTNSENAVIYTDVGTMEKSKNAFDEMIKDLWLYIEDYLNKYEYQHMQHTLNFYSLVKNGASIDEIKIFIYLYIKCYDTLQNDLFNEHKKICTGRVKNSKGLDM
ncbi:Plasmodium exported protein (PHISTa), unknown, putative [Plasmodium sp. gorilla clade G1]|nr:Plasmodium exported protein (PHISTa), unknown, putative [Plasmodium sp. gorilla clade G1]